MSTTIVDLACRKDEPMKAKWVTFDCFGTLMDWQTGFRNALASVAGGETDALIDAYHQAEHKTQDEGPTRPYRDVLKLTLQRAAATIGLKLHDHDADVLARTWTNMPIFPDTAASLDQLHSDGWKIAILTNCDNELFSETAATFPVKIDMLVTSQEVGSYKPSLGHFKEFEKRSGVAHDRWVHAAVSWYHDMQAAQVLGIKRIWVDREHTGQDASIVTAHIHDMASLPGALRSFGIE
jgi:2-haloacid dehalogenase